MKYGAPYVHVRLYQSWVIGLLGWDPDKATAFCKKNLNVDLDFTEKHGCCYSLEQGGAFICIVYTCQFSYKPHLLSLFGHECVHAAAAILGHIGQKIESDGECLTYLFQDIFQGLLEQHKGKKKIR